MLYPIELRVRKDRQANAKVREVKETASRETMVRDRSLWARLLHHTTSFQPVASPFPQWLKPGAWGSVTEERTEQKRRGFRPTVVGKIMPTDLFVTCPFPVSLRLLTRMG
jgi:hypothetical protein